MLKKDGLKGSKSRKGYFTLFPVVGNIDLASEVTNEPGYRASLRQPTSESDIDTSYRLQYV